MHVLVDLDRCQSYGQCVYAAPEIFTLQHEEILEWQYSAPKEQRLAVEQAVHACPVQAISTSTSGTTS